MQIEIHNNFNSLSQEQALHNQQLRAIKRPSSSYIKQKSISESHKMQLRLTLIDHVNSRQSHSVNDEMASDAIYNPIEQRTRAQRIPQSMELASIKKDLQNSLKVSNELLEESSTVKYLSNLKETTTSTPRAAI